MKSPALRYFPNVVINPSDERTVMGKVLRQHLPRSCHAEWKADPNRPDPITLLQVTDRNRLPSLVPIRYGRMLAGPADFLRGAAIVMAHDLSGTPQTGLEVQLCGDAHLGNFGGFATPERQLIFDINDFDETHQGPWEWDVKRLAASTMVTGRQNNLSDDACRRAVLSAVERYRQHMRTFGDMRFLDAWYTSIDAEEVVERLSTPGAHRALKVKAPRKTNVGAMSKLVESVDWGYRIANDPPLLTHRTYPLPQRISEIWSDYRSSLSEDHRVLLDRYQLVDIARKVVGVGSVGLRCFIALLLGANDEDPLFLQLKEARASVLEPFGRTSIYANQGKRVVSGQRIMQAASDLFLGWTHCGEVDYYVRQLRDMKFTVPIDELGGDDLAEYAGLCAWALARAHACSGDPAQISGYLGSGDAFDRALASFATSYADQTERDHAALVKAVKNGRISAETGI